MRVLIAGAGGVGGYIGAKFIKNGVASVSILARGSHLKAIQDSVLKVIEDNSSFSVKPENVTDNPRFLGVFDFILISVKSVDLEDTLKLLSSNIDSNTIIMPILNGIGHREIIQKYYPSVDILDGCIYIISHILKPSVIRKKGDIFRICWGKKGMGDSDYPQIRELFEKANLRYKATKDIDYEIWKKFLFISPMAALTSIYKIPMDEVYAKHKDELSSYIDEMIAIAKKEGVDIGEEEKNKTLKQASKILQGAKTSMQLDLEKGKKAEIDSLVGVLVKKAKEYHIKAPTIEKCYQALKK